MKTHDFNETFADELREPEYAHRYASLSYEENGTEGLLTALRDIAAANRSMSRVAEAAGVTRPALYRSLTEQGNPEFRTVRAALNALGMDFAIVASPVSSSPLQDEGKLQAKQQLLTT